MGMEFNKKHLKYTIILHLVKDQAKTMIDKDKGQIKKIGNIETMKKR
jgi:hypothetical protein